MYKLGFLSLLVYTVMLIGVEKYRMYLLPFAGLGILFIYLKKKRLESGSKKILFLYLAILGLGYVFNLLSESGSQGTDFFLLINSIFIFAFIFINFVETEKHLSILRDIFIFAGGILGVICISEYMRFYMRVQHNPSLMIYFRAGAFEKYFYSGVLLMTAGIMGTAKLYIEKIKWDSVADKIGTVLTIISLTAIFQGLLLTKTRSAIYTFALGYILILIYKFRWKKTAIFLLAFGTIYTLNPDHVKKFSETVTIKQEQEGYRQESDNQRRVMWKIAVETWKSSPIIGVGNDIKVVKKYMDINSKKFENESGYITGSMKGEDFRKRFTESHSLYLNILMQNGILILMYLGLFIYAIPELFYRNWKKIKGQLSGDKELYESINVGAMVGIVNLLIIGLAWDVWGWAFQVQEIFQYLLMFLMIISVHIKNLQGRKN